MVKKTYYLTTVAACTELYFFMIDTPYILDMFRFTCSGKEESRKMSVLALYTVEFADGNFSV